LNICSKNWQQTNQKNSKVITACSHSEQIAAKYYFSLFFCWVGNGSTKNCRMWIHVAFSWQHLRSRAGAIGIRAPLSHLHLPATFPPNPHPNVCVNCAQVRTLGGNWVCQREPSEKCLPTVSALFHLPDMWVRTTMGLWKPARTTPQRPWFIFQRTFKIFGKPNKEI